MPTTADSNATIAEERTNSAEAFGSTRQGFSMSLGARRRKKSARKLRQSYTGITLRGKCRVIVVVNGPLPASFFFIFFFSIQLTVDKCSTDRYKNLPMTAFEPWTSGVDQMAKIFSQYLAKF